MDVDKVGNAISYLRKRAGYTQKELAERIGISDKAVSKWERGQGLPEIGYLRKLSILLDTDSDSLLAGDVAHSKSDWAGIIVLGKNQYGINAGTIIYDKPLINYLISYFLLVGIKCIYIACTDIDKDYIDNELGTGENYGISINTIVGTLEDVSMAINNDSNDLEDNRFDNIMLLHGRCILYGVDQTRFFQKAMLDREHVTMMALPKKLQKVTIALDENKRVVNDGLDDSKTRKLRTQYDFSEIPIMFFPIALLSAIAEASSINDYIEEQKKYENIYVETLDRGFVEIEVDDWNNVQEASSFMRIVQDKCGMNVYCIEEVAWRRGMISLKKLKELGETKRNTEYGQYVLSLYDRLNERVLSD